MLSNTLRLNFCYLIIHILHSRCHPKIIGHILKNVQKKKTNKKYKQKKNKKKPNKKKKISKKTNVHEIMRLIVLKKKMKMKHRSHR